MAMQGRVVEKHLKISVEFSPLMVGIFKTKVLKVSRMTAFVSFHALLNIIQAHFQTRSESLNLEHELPMRLQEWVNTLQSLVAKLAEDGVEFI